MASMRLTTLILSGQPITGDEFAWFKMLIGFDVIFTALAVTLIDTVLVG
jgi:heme exporter protein B